MKQVDILIIGGGAAGFFAAINAAEKNPSLRICILERSRDFLQKVKVSGGGRCNVTHACFEPNDLVKFYPRGEKELLEPFLKFNPKNTIEWFGKRGVILKTEADGRMFPTTDSSQTIVDCLVKSAQQAGIEILTNTRAERIIYNEHLWQINVSENRSIEAKKLMIATGSDSAIWKLLESLDLTIISPVPSLFTFHIKDARIADLMGLSVENAKITLLNNEKSVVPSTQITANGPLLITHWGLSGPSILRLSAWAAPELSAAKYNFKIQVNWLNISSLEVQKHLHSFINLHPKKNVLANNEFGVPIRLWKNLCKAADISEFQKWAETGKKHIQRLSEQLTNGTFQVSGKSTFKDEFVTAGGVDLSEIDLKTFSSKKYPTLFMAGEVLNIDALTGGFNFQAAWTGGYLAAQQMAEK